MKQAGLFLLWWTAATLMAATPATAQSMAADSAGAFSYLGRVEEAAKAAGSERVAAQTRIDADAPGFQGAFEWFLATNRGSEATRLAQAMNAFLPEPAARNWFERLLALPVIAADPKARLPLLVTASSLAFQTGDQARASAWAHDLLREAQAAADNRGVWTAHFRLSQVALRARDVAEFHRINAEMLAFCREVKDEVCEAQARNMAGEAARVEKNYSLAWDLNQQNVEYGQEVNRPRTSLIGTINQTFIDAARGVDGVDARLRETFDSFKRANDRQNVAVIVAILGTYKQSVGQPEAAARLFGAADAALERLGALPDPADQDQIALSAGDVERQIKWRAFAQAFNEGRALTLDEALARSAMP